MRLKRPTRKLWRTEPARRSRRTFLPYLVLLRVGFSLPPRLPGRGALLPHLFTLTSSNHRNKLPWRSLANVAASAPLRRTCWGGWTRRYIFCGTFRPRRLNAAARTLSGTPLCGVRTFLSLPAQPSLPPKRAAEAEQLVSADRQRPSGPAANSSIIDAPQPCAPHAVRYSPFAFRQIGSRVHGASACALQDVSSIRPEPWRFASHYSMAAESQSSSGADLAKGEWRTAKNCALQHGSVRTKNVVRSEVNSLIPLTYNGIYLQTYCKPFIL